MNTANRSIARWMGRDPAPLSFAQQRLWFLSQLQPNSLAYNVPQVFRLKGPLEILPLERALNEIRRRHDVLRTNVDIVDDQPVQVIEPFQYVPLTVTDVGPLPEHERDKACQNAIDACVRAPFDLKRDRLMRAMLVRLQPTHHILVLVMHHIVFDGWSAGVFAHECASLYDAFIQGEASRLPELPIQYSDYARWQRGWLQGEVLETQLSYWKKQLAGAPPVLDLPADRCRLGEETARAAHLVSMLPQDLLHSLRSLSHRHNATLFMTMMAAFQILLHRLTGQEDIVLGMPIAGRTHLETEKLLGFFVNTLPLRTDLTGNPTFVDVLARSRGVVLDAIQHQDVPFEKLVEELQPPRSVNRTPLFQVMLNLFPIDPDIRIAGLTIENLRPSADESKFDLTLYIIKERQDFLLKLVYNAGLFDEIRMKEMLDQFVSLLRQIVAEPDRVIDSYSLLTDTSRRLLPDPSRDIPEPTTVPVVNDFVARVRETPQRIAVEQSGRSWTFEELLSRASAVATALVAQGVQPAEVVALSSARNIGLVAGMVGIFMSGGVLLTVDRNLPVNRQRLLLTEARAKCLVYIGEWRQEDDWLRDVPGLTIVRVPGRADCAPAPVSEVSLPEISPNNPAYIFFTSGTTGVPKGVLGSHKGLSHFLEWQRRTFDVGPNDRCAQLSSQSFDVVLRDIFLPLVSGATLCLPDEDADIASDLTLSWIIREAITLFHGVPALAHAWLGSGDAGAIAPMLRWAFFAGEPLTDTLVTRWHAVMPQTGHVVNLYGPTETTLVKCFHIVSREPAAGIQPIGKPMPYTHVLLLNGDSQLCGAGEAGEIAIRTPFRTLGYINAPDEQQKRFIRNPFSDNPQDLIYCTGDRGRYRLDGTLEFLGRIDDQVKIHGVRIEPAEITAILARHPKVRTCFVTVTKSAQGETRLICYVVTIDGSTPRSDLRAYLAQELPPVMVPAEYVFLSALPLTPNGKIDRKALALPACANAGVRPDFTAPQTPLEQSLARIWHRVLNLEQVGVQDNFFDVGGHSLIATQVVSHIRRELGVELPLQVIFARPTIESLARYLLEQTANTTNPEDIEALLAGVEELTDEGAEEALSILDDRS